MRYVKLILAVVLPVWWIVGCESKSTSDAGRSIGQESRVTDAYEIWSSSDGAHTVHSVAFNWETHQYLYWLSTDVPLEPYENFPKKGIILDDGEDTVVLDAILGSEVRLEKVDLNGTEALVVMEMELESAIRAGLVLLNRHHGDVENPWSRVEDTEFEKLRSAERTKRAEQGGAGQPR